eukprot:13475414-Alexandrium_andersonii.AAC.1
MVGNQTSDFRCQPRSKMTASRRRGIGRVRPPAGRLLMKQSSRWNAHTHTHTHTHTHAHTHT